MDDPVARGCRTGSCHSVRAPDPATRERKPLLNRLFGEKPDGDGKGGFFRKSEPAPDSDPVRSGDEAGEDARGPAPQPRGEKNSRNGDESFETFQARAITLTKSPSEIAVDEKIAGVHEELQERIHRFTDPDLALRSYPGDGVPGDFNESWGRDVQRSYWEGQTRMSRTLESVFSAAMRHSHRVKDLQFVPRITETSISAAEGEFDPEIYGEVKREHIDEPTGSTLSTGTTGRLVEENWTGEGGIRKKIRSGAELSLSNDLLGKRNNSTFLDPNPQSQSEVRLRVAQPLLRGSGVDYNTISIKVANLDTRIASERMVNALEDFLLGVNRSYWSVYLARAAYALRLDLVDTTADVASLLEEREEIDAEATASEIVRAKAALLERKADLVRSKTAIRTAEERLRSLLNDPDMPMGAAAEMIPSSRPVLSPPTDDVETVARLALDNRAELAGSEQAIRIAGLRRDAARHELQPQLNLVGEVGYAGLDRGRRLSGAYHDMDEHGTGWALGLTFSQPWERRFAKSFEVRRNLEYDQAVNQFRVVGDEVMLDVLVSYREVVTAYQDMQAKYQAVRASREEVRKLDELVGSDAGEDSGRTIGSRLQLLLDAIERNQVTEESYLVSVIAYNYALAALERAKGTFVRVEGPAK